MAGDLLLAEAGNLELGPTLAAHQVDVQILDVLGLCRRLLGVERPGRRSREGAQVVRCEDRLRVATGYVERHLGLIANYLEPTITPGGRVQKLHLADLMSAVRSYEANLAVFNATKGLVRKLLEIGRQ